MDSESWTAGALFSPSKARHQQAQAKDWAYVETWLAKKYAPRAVPAFERNDDTLQALLMQANSNEAADLERDLIDRVEQNADEEFRKEVSTAN